MNPEKVLPPGVNGKISGHLTIKVDEVFWARNSPGDVFVELLWWGEKDSAIFRPEDITHNAGLKNDVASVTYCIRTSPGLFESYIRNCGKLTFNVLRGQKKNVFVGSAVVRDINKIIEEKNFYSYFPVFSPKGTRIGDLHICFELKFILKESHFVKKYKGEKESGQPKHLPSKHPLPSTQLSAKSSSSSHKDQFFTDLLQKSSDLRRAMVMSVLADCPADKIESIMGSESDFMQTNTNQRKKDVKLVDFLLGKEMTKDEEIKALDTLRCISPDQNIINIAKLSSENSKSTKVTKSSCCLHGDKCNKKQPNSLKSCSAPDFTEPLCFPQPSSSSVQISQDDFESKTEEEVHAQTHNCYRLVVKTFSLNSDGRRKIYYAPLLSDMNQQVMKSNPPGTNFIMEISLPSKGPWAKSLKFTTKRYKDKTVNFDQGAIHKLCGTVTWARVRNLIVGSTFTIYWRHLNQRIPCPLGSTRLESFDLPSESDSLSLSLPVYTNTRLLTGHLSISICLAMTTKIGGEAVFRLVETKSLPTVDTAPPVNDFPELDDFPSVESKTKNITVPSIPVYSPSSDNDNEPEQVQNSLDDELLRTINLLNSKTDNIDEDCRKLTPQDPIIRKKEACVQTSLIAPDCPDCVQWDRNIEKCRADKDNNSVIYKPEIICPSEKGRYSDLRQEIINASSKYSKYNDKQLTPTFVECFDSKESRCQYIIDPKNPLVSEREGSASRKIHEFTIKIEKVSGIPLFTGDNDLDCYIDYSFPKVDSVDQIIFDQIPTRTDVLIAVKVVEFKSVSRHKLRLGCGLTKALITLPKHYITFNLYGRYYEPASQDIRLGKVLLPLQKLTALELKYEQQIERKLIVEKFILPISMIDSPVTSGYKGPFGEMHISIEYSNTSNMLYKEWKCKLKGDHMCCKLYQHQLEKSNGQFRLTTPDYICSAMQSINDNNSESKVDIENKPLYYREVPKEAEVITSIQRNDVHKTWHDLVSRNSNDVSERPVTLRSRKPEYLRNELNSNWEAVESISSRANSIPVNFGHRNYPRKLIKETDIQNNYREFAGRRYSPFLPEEHENRTHCVTLGRVETKSNNAYTKEKGTHLTAEGYEKFDPSSSNKNSENPKGIKEFNESENIVAKVIKDLRERKEHKERNSIKKNQKSNGKKENCILGDSKDAFESFDMRVDLSNGTDSIDFEARSEYSFLKTPPPINSTFHNNNFSDFENDSSSANKIQGERVNPFSRQSNLSFSLNSESSIFNPPINKSALNNHQHILKSATSQCAGNDSQKGSIDLKITQRKENRKQSMAENRNQSLTNDICEVSSNETLKSVESINSFKEDLLPLDSRGAAVGPELDRVNKDMHTSFLDKNYFKANVEICGALGLPSLEVRFPDGKISLVKPTSQAYFTALIGNKETVLRTPIFEKSSNPVWNSSWDVFLPVELLMKSDRELEIFVDLIGGADECPVRSSDVSIHWPIVLRTGVDLTSMTAGLSHASGWFSLSDRALLSRAQLRVTVIPAEDISRFRVEWLKEYARSKGRKMDMFIPETGSSLASSLQEKLVELDKLTQRMKSKLANRSNWDESPPINLLTEVQQQEIELYLNDITNKDIRPEKRRRTVESATSPIVLDDDFDDKNTIISISDEDIEGSSNKETCGNINTYTVSNCLSADNHETNDDSLETPSLTFARILNRVRQNR